MGSRKPSAKARQVAEFRAGLGGLGDAFESERRRQEEQAARRDAAHREKACASKNRYATRGEALDAIRACEAHGASGLHVYRCPYCRGWHLTSHPWE